jgi:hypothetical protein
MQIHISGEVNLSNRATDRDTQCGLAHAKTRRPQDEKEVLFLPLGLRVLACKNGC